MRKNFNILVEEKVLEELDKKIKELNIDPFKPKKTKTSVVNELIINFIRKR